MRQVVSRCLVVACVLVPGVAAAGSESGVSAWAYVTPDAAVTHASPEQAERIAAVRQAGESFFWFEQGGRDYVIRDSAALSRIATVLGVPREAQQQLGGVEARQTEFRAAHGQVWSAYADMATAMSPLAARERDLTTRRAGHLVDRQRSFWEREVDDLDKPFERRDREFDDQMEALYLEINAVADRAEGIEAGHRALAEQKLAWDRQRRKAAAAWGEARDAAAAQMRPLLDQALATGTALPVR
jgi:hypothetical protein